MSFLWSSDYRNGMKIVKHKQEFVYREKMKYEKWMKGGLLSFQGLVKSCTKQAKLITVPAEPGLRRVGVYHKKESTFGLYQKIGSTYNFYGSRREIEKRLL